MAIKIAGNRVLDYDVLSYSNTNIAVGYQTLQSLTTGTNNSAVGNSALYDLTTATNNTVIGYNSGRGITTGSKNTIIGANVTGLSATLANTIILADGDGNKRIYVDSSGNVGIGMTPSYRLHAMSSGTSTSHDSNIIAVFNTNGSGYNTSIRLSDSVANSTTWSMVGGTARLGINGVASFYYNDAGNVGIGTSSPFTILDVTTTVNNLAITSSTYNAGPGIAAGYFGQAARGTVSSPTATQSGDRTVCLIGRSYGGSTWVNHGAVNLYCAENQSESARGSYLTFDTTATGATGRSERMRIDSSGNVSINTSTSGSKLQVVGTASLGSGSLNSVGSGYNVTFTGANAKATASGNAVVALMTNDALASNPLTLELDLFGNPTATSRYAIISCSEYGTGNYRSLALQPYGGNVGIGTSSPGKKLEIYDNNTSEVAVELLRLNNPSVNATNNGMSIGFFQGATQHGRIRAVYTSTNLWTFNLGYGANDHLTINNSGNVGIGTSPLTNFHVNGSAVGPAGEVGNLLITAGTTAKRLALGVDSSGTMYSWIQSVENGVVQRALSLQPIGGNVGIGTTSPNAKLQVVGNLQVGNNTADWLYLYNTGYGIRASSGLEIQSADYIRLLTSGANERMRILSTGEVGIGISSPTATLHVNASATTASSLTWGATAGQILRNEASELAIGLLNASPYPLWIQGRTNSNTARDIVLQPSGGNVGIGTTSPGKKLDIISGSEVGLRIAASTTSGYAYIQLGQSATAANNWHFGSENDGSLRFYSGNWGAGTFRAYLNNLNNGTFHINDVAIGRGAGANLANVAVGYLALNTNNAAAGANTAVGSYAMQYNTTGFDNTAVGYFAFRNNTISNYSTAIGAYALENNTTGDNNTAVGSSALRANTTGFQNAALGTLALRNNTTGWGNTAVGWYALVNNTTGSTNTALGRYALQANTVGSNNTAIGLNAMLYTTTGTENVAVGTGSLQTNTTGSYNVAVGYAALNASTTANHNTALGYLAGLSTTSGFDNCAFGSQCFQNNTTGYGNIAIGRVTLISNTTGFQNTAVGYLSMYYSTTGYNNCALGVYALHKNTTGNDNTALGTASLQENTTGYRNSAVGMYALVNNTTGYNNNAVGYETLRDATTGFQNTAIGHNTGRGITTGSKNTIIGANVTGLSATLANNIIIADGDGNQRIKVDSTPNIEMISKLYLTSNGNLKIGGSTNRGTQGTNNLNILDGTAPSGTLYTGITIYSSSGECYVMDSNGNATQISPHDRQTNEWIFNSTDTRTGKTLRIDVERLLRFVNDHFGLDCVHDFMVESR